MLRWRSVIPTGLLFLLIIAMLAGCRSTKYVPEGSYLLDKINVRVDGENPFTNEELVTYLRQLPNHKMLWLTKFRLGIYNMSGRDSTKWWNRRLRALGEAPVIYDSLLTENGRSQLEQAFINKGYLGADVVVDTVRIGDRKISIDYVVTPGTAHHITSLEREYKDSHIESILASDTLRSALRVGDALDVTLLELERERLTSILRNNGYYTFNKEMITFSADTTTGS